MNFKQASRLAAAWVEIVTEGEARIVQEGTIAKPYGWLFFYQSNEFLDKGTPGAQLGGNAPILVDRINSELRVFGTAYPLEDYLKEYEQTLPPACLAMCIEPPSW